jgi:hypothetical protein
VTQLVRSWIAGECCPLRIGRDRGSARSCSDTDSNLGEARAAVSRCLYERSAPMSRSLHDALIARAGVPPSIHSWPKRHPPGGCRLLRGHSPRCQLDCAHLSTLASFEMSALLGDPMPSAAAAVVVRRQVEVIRTLRVFATRRSCLRDEQPDVNAKRRQGFPVRWVADPNGIGPWWLVVLRHCISVNMCRRCRSTGPIAARSSDSNLRSTCSPLACDRHVALSFHKNCWSTSKARGVK